MMETERRSQKKHRCKHCRKSFPSGRSLGGHMRCHAPAAPAATSPASEPDDKPQSKRSVVVGGFSPAYGLRENPKKTWRISADDAPAHAAACDKSCRECGKRFASWKSLFGHMRSHSLKQLSTIEQEEEEQQQEQEQEQQQQQQSKAEEEVEEEEEEASRSPSDTVFGNVHVPRKRRRSRRAIASASVSASEEYEKEDEEGAITLLMLSRDVRCWSDGGGGLGLIHCVQESSDKNSVVVENKRVDLASDESGETKKAKRTRRSQLGDSRNGRRNGGTKKVESGASDNGLIVDHGFEQFEDSRKDPSSNSASEFGIKRERSELEASLHGASNGYFDDGKLAETRQRKSRSFECADCDKAFHSYQALGGHRASHHKRIDQNADLKAGRGGSGKKAADHECSICGRSFASGQALGGHKKSHLGVIQQQKLPEKLNELVDLNIPASTTEGDCVSTNNGVDSELNSW